jgi:1-deoxy-D-xylulose-5-phosphate reductoisomerase
MAVMTHSAMAQQGLTSTPRSIVLLGATGSIGTQTIDVVRRLGPERARLVGLAAHRNEKLLEELAQRMAVPHTALTATDGAEALVELASLPEADTVVVAVAGAAALQATLAACRLGKRVCIATKEVLVAAGELVMQTAHAHGAEILPIDSEHSALFQCIQGYRTDQIAKLWLTASGGPFRTWSAEQIAHATVQSALNHPTWKMGGKITVDSATLMNKGLEIIEAKWLFGVPLDSVQVVVHPQSVVHSFVEMTDGALLAQLGLPDMRLPIQIALVYPEKPDLELPRLKPSEIANLTFEEPDHSRFPSLNLSRHAAALGGTYPAVLNAANEEAVGVFLQGQIRFTDIFRWVEESLSVHTKQDAGSLENILAADAEARRWIKEKLAQRSALV